MSTANLVLFSYASKTYCTFHILKKLTSDRFIEQTLIKNHYIAVINIRKTQNHNCLPKLKTYKLRFNQVACLESKWAGLSLTKCYYIYPIYSKINFVTWGSRICRDIQGNKIQKRAIQLRLYPLIIVSLLQSLLEPWQQVHRIKRLILALDGNLKRMWVREGVIC